MDVQWRQEIPEDVRKHMITEMYVSRLPRASLSLQATTASNWIDRSKNGRCASLSVCLLCVYANVSLNDNASVCLSLSLSLLCTYVCMA